MRDDYTDEDARFDAEAQGRCPICGGDDCGHCRECGRLDCDGGCMEPEECPHCGELYDPEQEGERCPACEGLLWDEDYEERMAERRAMGFRDL